MDIAHALLTIALHTSAIAPAGTPAPRALQAKLLTLAGSGQDCGTVDRGDDRAAAIACARAAMASAKPFRIVLQLQGVGSWQAAARDDRGRLWALFYDADISAEPGSGPTLSELMCREITFSQQDGEDALDCSPILGER